MISGHSNSEKISSNLDTTVREYITNLGFGDQTLLAVDLANAIADYPENFAVLIIDGEGIGKANRDSRFKGDRRIKTIADGIHANVRLHDEENISELRATHPEFTATEKDRAYHLSGDEFAVLLLGISNSHDLESWRARFILGMEERGVGVYVGGAIHTAGSTDHDVVTQADKAMQHEKRVYKMSSLNAEKLAFMTNFIRQAQELGIETDDVPTIAEILRSQNS